MLKVIGLKNCDTVRKSLKWLDDKGVDYKFRDIKRNPLEDTEVLDLVKKLSIETVINKRGTTWRDLGVADQNLSDQELFDLIVENQSMIKRPVIYKDEAVMIGFDPDALESFLEE